MTHETVPVLKGKILSFALECELSELDRLHCLVERFGAVHELQKKTIFETNLALEEIFTNVVSYGHEDRKGHKVHFFLECDGGKVSIRIEDDGRPFNLLETKPADLGKGLEQRLVGGLGIHLVREVMDEVKYSRIEGKNVVTLLKHCRNTGG